MNPTGVVVHARPDWIDQVREYLNVQAGGAAVHAASVQGRLVVTVEAQTDAALASIFARLLRSWHSFAVSWQKSCNEKLHQKGGTRAILKNHVACEIRAPLSTPLCNRISLSLRFN